MDIITPFQVYMIVKLDTVVTVLGVAMGLLGAVTLLTLAMAIDVDCCPDEDDRKANWKYFLRFAAVEIVLVLLLVLIPNTKQACAIVGIPAVVNSEKVQKIGSDALDITAKGIEYLKEKLEEKK